MTSTMKTLPAKIFRIQKIEETWVGSQILKMQLPKLKKHLGLPTGVSSVRSDHSSSYGKLFLHDDLGQIEDREDQD